MGTVHVVLASTSTTTAQEPSLLLVTAFAAGMIGIPAAAVSFVWLKATIRGAVRPVLRRCLAVAASLVAYSFVGLTVGSRL